MAIIRQKRPYAIVNKYILMEESLSWGAKGLYSALCAHGNDDDITIKELADYYYSDEKTVKRLLNELIEIGAVKFENRNEEKVYMVL